MPNIAEKLLPLTDERSLKIYLQQINKKKKRKESAINYLYQLDGVTQYFQLSSKISLAGDFEVEIDLGDSFTRGYIFGDSTSSTSTTARLAVAAGGAMSGWFTGTFAKPAGNVLWAKRVGGVLSGNFGGSAAATGTLTLDRLFGLFGGTTTIPVGNAAPKNFKLWTGGDRATGTLTLDLPLNQYPYSVQVPSIPALGANLYTQAVIENPWRIQSGWTANGGGVFTLDNNGDYAGLNFLQVSGMPSAGVVEFEVVEISAGGEITCTENAVSGSKFNTVGVKRFYYSDISVLGGTGVVFKRSLIQPIRCVIKNIRHYNAAGVPVATIQNYTEGGWVQQ